MCAIRGTAHCDVHTTSDWQGVDQPDAVFCIVSDRRFPARAIVSAAAISGQTGQVSVSPGSPTIQRGRPTDIVSAAAEDTGYLKCGHDRSAVCESAWFNFRHVLGGRIGEAILADLSENACLGGSWDRTYEADGESQSRGKHCPADARAGKRIQRFH